MVLESSQATTPANASHRLFGILKLTLVLVLTLIPILIKHQVNVFHAQRLVIRPILQILLAELAPVTPITFGTPKLIVLHAYALSRNLLFYQMIPASPVLLSRAKMELD